MGVLGDTIDEFKKAPTNEKIFIAGGAIAVVAIMLYVHRQSSSAGTPTPNVGGSGTTSGGGAGGIQTVPTASGGSVPILPPGLQPIYGPGGDLQGYQPVGSGGTTTTPTTGGAFNPWKAALPQSVKVPNQSGSFFSYNGIDYTIIQGPGRTWGVVGKMPLSQAQNVPIGSGKYLLAGDNPSYYTNLPQGGGPYGTRVLSVKGARIAPTIEGRRQYTHATKIMAYHKGRAR